MLDFAVNTVK